MAAQLWHVQARIETPAIHFKRQHRHLHFLAVIQRQVRQAAGGIQVHIVKQILRPLDRRERQAGLLAHVHDLLLGQRGQPLPHQRQDSRTGMHTLGVARQFGVAAQLFKTKRLAEAQPLAVTHHAHEHLLVIPGVEHVIDRPR